MIRQYDSRFLQRVTSLLITAQWVAWMQKVTTLVSNCFAVLAIICTNKRTRLVGKMTTQKTSLQVLRGSTFLEFVGVTCESSSILSWPILFLPLKSYNMNLTDTMYGAPWHRNVRVPVGDSPNFCDAWSWWGL